MWEINLNLQIEGFLWSAVFGVAFCIVFDILNIISQNLNFSKPVIFFVDIVYFTVVAFVSFCLFLAFCCGEIRAFIFVGEMLGFFLCKKTLSKIYTPIIFILLSLTKRLFLWVNRLIFKPFFHIFAKINKIVNKIRLKSEKRLEKI